MVDVEVIRHDKASGVTVVSLPAPEPGYDVATASPAPSDTVLVDGQPPRVVAIGDLAALDVDEGTPVLDADGDLVGLCADSGGTTALRTVATMPPTKSEPRTSTTAPTTAATTAAPATTAPATTAATTTTSPPSTTDPTANTVSGDDGASGAPG